MRTKPTAESIVEALASTVFDGMEDFNGADPGDVMWEIASVILETFYPDPATNVNAWLDANYSEFGNPLDYDFKTIQAIKAVRTEFGLGLKVAKDAVEDWRRGLGYKPRVYV
jgi:hypothetical protein